MGIRYKEKCARCKSNYVSVWRRRRAVVHCYDCQKKEMIGEITDPQMKELFDIPETYYKENTFLGSIKLRYMKYSNLTEKQIQAFKDVVAMMREELPQEDL